METAGLFERQEPLDPAIALVTGRAQRALTPQHPKAQGPLRPVVGRFYALLGEKDPEGVHLSQQAAGKPSGVIGAVMILLDQLAEPGVPCAPLPPSRRGGGHVAQAL